ncbi:MAG: hypothetical protein COW85_01670 [Ignavibacteria bacterium CG22_combo_CG10-13_8_21_14_all_37_15]|nr:MAG: hypothetical protein COW85_01670 [Ignavibacteria bacterium CG22_combo_CG10-13_8_21_14_all_37_15]
MKKHFQHIILFLFAAFFFGCGKPGPTELVDDRPSEEFPLQYEVLAKNPDDALYKNGYDSTGLLIPPPPSDVFLFISKNILSEKYLSLNYDNAQVFFFDKGKPIMLPNGKQYGCQTKKVIPPRINAILTKEVDNLIRTGPLTAQHDTVIGPKYVLRRVGLLGDSLSLHYNSSVKFEYREKMMGSPIELNLNLPEQIIGNVSVSKNGKGENILLLTWNKASKDSVEIIVGGILKDERAATAFYKFHVKDNGQVKIPRGVMSAIPKDRFDRLVFSFVRKAVSRQMKSSLEFFTVIQNTHSIIIDYP